MGAGAAGIIGATRFDLFAQRKKRPVRHRMPDKRIATDPTATGILRWPVTNTPPKLDSSVTAIFWGLIGFCYNDQHDSSPVCEVGFHPGNGGHKLTVKAYKKFDDRRDCEEIPLTLPSKIGTMDLRVIGSSGTSPEFFQKDNEPFDRYRVGGDYEYDFRWLPDLDGADFYPEAYKKNKRYGARLFLSNGTLYTRLRTGSKFKLIDAKTNRDIRRFGYVARYMAAAIGAQGNDFVRFQVNGKTVKDFPREVGFTYQIVFKNECDNCLPPNANDPTDETRRNDFHFNRKVVSIPRNRTKYGLRLEETGTSSPNFCPVDRLNDEAPCMGSGYGQTPAFP